MSTPVKATGRKYGKIEATLEAKPLGYGRFQFVKLQPRLTNSDGTPNQAANVLYGDATEQTFELVSGQFSEWIPADDLSDIYVRVLPGGIANTCTVAWVGSDRPNI
jgi:hypothetical protein